ncbi:glycoside hydrolase superfamily [Abortiporus biennis]|nr:glycoside hydrolase superfamily [Abortiporus biennis]
MDSPGTPDPSRPFLASGNPSIVDEKAVTPREEEVAALNDIHSSPTTSRTSGRKKLWIILGSLAALIIVVLAVVLPVVLVAVKKHNNGSSASSSSSNGGGSGATGPPSNPESPSGATSGGDGSVIITEDGSKFTYVNKFGGTWVDDPKDPFNNGARPQSFSPALNETWDFTVHQIRGVNLGGWLVTEPFIVPALYEKYQNVTPPATKAVDEWTLSVAMSNDTSPGGGLGQLEDHYKTFITEQDFAEIAGAGLNWVRLPVPYWAVETWPGEAFLEKTAWTYALKAIKWARKYGLRMYLELHTAPGSQNGLNHSGRLGPINFLNGPMGIANAQRVFTYDRILAEFISQPEYQAVVQMFGVLNEPLMGIIGRDALDRYYFQTYEMLRNITGTGQGHGAYMVMHDGFQGLTPWKGYLAGADRMILDTHPYVAFGGGLDQPINFWPPAACRAFQVNQSNIDFGITITGEFSSAINDCGLWIKGVDNAPTASNCDSWDDWPNWTQDMKNGILQFTMASMDAMHFPGYFFWTWKIGNSSVTGKVESPMWSYQLGLQNGWVPQDPRDAIGICDTLGVQFNQPISSYLPWQTGGSGAGQIEPTALASVSQYPPPQISNVAGDPLLLPHYTDTSVIPTLPTPTFSGATVTMGENGWADPSDTELAAAPILGCTYPDAWFAPATATAFDCGVAAVAPTPPPT